MCVREKKRSLPVHYHSLLHPVEIDQLDTVDNINSIRQTDTRTCMHTRAHTDTRTHTKHTHTHTSPEVPVQYSAMSHSLPADRHSVPEALNYIIISNDNSLL